MLQGQLMNKRFLIFLQDFILVIATLRYKRRRIHLVLMIYMVIEPRWEGLNSRKCNWEKRYRSTSSRSRRKYDEERARRDRALNANAYKEMIDSYLTNSNKVPIQEEEASIKDPWMKTSNLGQKNEAEKTSQRVEEEELSEMDKLWQEMEEAMTTCLLEETKVQQLIFPHSLNLFHVLYFFFFGTCIFCFDLVFQR